MFKEPIDFAVALANDRQFKDVDGNLYYYDKSKSCPFRFKIKDDDSSVQIIDNWQNFNKVTEFFDFHDQLPLLCYASNHNSISNLFKIIVSYNIYGSYYTDNSGNNWTIVKPVTDESLIYKRKD